MAHLCCTCHVTVVQYANKVCAKCRNAGRKDLQDYKVQVVAAGELVDPRALIDQQFMLLNEQQVALRSIMREEQTYRSDLGKDLRELNAALMHTLKEWRMHEKDAKHHVAALSKDDMRQVLLDWLAAQEESEQDEFIEALYARRPAGHPASEQLSPEVA